MLTQGPIQDNALARLGSNGVGEEQAGIININAQTIMQQCYAKSSPEPGRKVKM